MPTLGSYLSLQVLFSYYEGLNIPHLHNPAYAILFVITASFLMGMAFIPTTLLTALTGFIWGWVAFPLLIVAYTLATVIGYSLGLRVSKEELNLLLDQYPKAQALVEEKRDKMGSLIFFIRLSPVIPFAFSNVLFALLKTGIKRIVWFGLWGMLPRTTLVFASGTLAESLYLAVRDEENSYELAVIFLLLILSIIGILRFFRKQKKIREDAPVS